ncbi:hypothetical protein BC833DRAFT_587263 [Globomyces pollinis-pini]|nr:hypothetical protein BC833DRAFT_587263 [Globomyces pollinis-pini]
MLSIVLMLGIISIVLILGILFVVKMLGKRLAVVTGATRGIGRAITNLLRQNDFNVISVSKNTISNSMDPPLHQLHADLSDLDSIPRLLSQIREVEIASRTNVSLLVNSAGVNQDGLLLSTEINSINSIINTNLTASILLSQGLLKSFIKSRNGCIINVSSIVGPVVGNKGQTIYAASKAGLVGFTKSLAQEVGRKGIRVNSIAPGFIHTDMTKDIPSDMVDKYLERIPLRRFGTPEEVAQAAWLLIQSDYITGQCLVVDGGFSL